MVYFYRIFSDIPRTIVSISQENRIMTRIPIFKTGTHTDSQGNQRTWTSDDLKKIEKNYNEQPKGDEHEAPVVLGHPKTDSPQYGKVKKLDVEDNHLYATVDVAKGLKDAVNDGFFSKVSAAFRAAKDGHMLRHLGVLGATPPAIKGLPSLSFEDSKDLKSDFAIAFEFSEDSDYDKSTNTQTDTGTKKIEELIDKKINEFGESMTDEIKDKIIAGLKSKLSSEVAADAIKIVNDAMSAAPEEGGKDKDSKDGKSAPKFSDTPEYQEFKEREEAQAKQIAELEKKNRKNEFNEFMKDMNLTPAQKTLGIHLLEATHDSEHEFEFSEGDETKKLNDHEAVKLLLKKSESDTDLTQQFAEAKVEQGRDADIEHSINELQEGN
jgi:hypothetical protein